MSAEYASHLERCAAEALREINLAREADPELLNNAAVTQARAWLCTAVDAIEAKGREELADA